MDEPFGIDALAFIVDKFASVETIAIDPEPQAFCVLDTEIIPREGGCLVLPPLHRNAFRPFRPNDRMSRTPPCETRWRAIWNGCSCDLDFLWPLEQPQRA